VTFRVRVPGGAEREVDPADMLTPVQARMAATQPDMIRQIADFLLEKHPAAEIRADAWASLNGRPSERLIDPDVDLARAPNGLAPKPWITRGPRE
jgi:hypothetical protein